MRQKELLQQFVDEYERRVSSKSEEPSNDTNQQDEQASSQNKNGES